ncbi:hypothetical protein GCM10025868_19480 [Angustibacter aerolatus]|uniref:Uncharacterized protein n=1 Tax=Angustibacter aerolatus TaxID=1162965 RepID=A0ABQ6JEV2_9ACTN|nr:hypothetical protein [Angustibacter aerolatus]GMA86698.1 hypothetical protein GCM10025868_19480 [Angustibacter aerolatus]
MPKKYYASGQNVCLDANPVPFLPQVAAPVGRLATIGLDVQFAIVTSQITCQVVVPGSADGASLVALGRQAPSHRFMLGITSIGDAERYRLDTAALQTRVSDDASADLTTDAGRSFVGPTTESLRVSAKLLRPDREAGHWTVPVSTITRDTAGAGAYPGAMVVYASVPTQGLDAADAKGYAGLVRWAVQSGQRPGPANGHLAAGYLPLTATNGLGRLAGYSLAAADAIAAQRGQVPDITTYDAQRPTPKPTASSSDTPGGPPGGGHGGASASGGSGGSGGSGTGGGPATKPAGTGAPSGAPSAAPTAPTVIDAAPVATTTQSIGLLGLLPMAVVGLAVLAGVGAGTTWGVRRLRGTR